MKSTLIAITAVAALGLSACGDPIDYLANAKPVVQQAFEGFGIPSGPVDVQMSGSRTLMVQVNRLKKPEGDLFASGLCQQIAKAMSAKRDLYPDLIQIYDMQSSYWTQCEP